MIDVLLGKVFFEKLTKSKLKIPVSSKSMERPKKEEKDTQNGNSSPEVYDLDLIQLLDMCYQSPHPTPLPS